MPKRGQKLYRVRDGQLETVVFLEESILDGAFMLTWRVREAGEDGIFKPRIRCSVGSYFETTEEAWLQYLNDLRSCRQSQQTQLERTLQAIEQQDAEIANVVHVMTYVYGERPELSNVP